MACYDTIGIDCILMTVKDLIWRGRPTVSLQLIISHSSTARPILDSLAIGLAEARASRYCRFLVVKPQLEAVVRL